MKSRRPPLRLTLTEGIALIRPAPKPDIARLLATAPRGDGHTVLVLPALARGDPYTARFREFLSSLGYTAYGWNLGINIGPTRRLLDGAADRLLALSSTNGPVSIVGFSLGGLFGRWLALRSPERVRQVISVCSPIHEPARNFWLPLQPVFGLWRGHDLRSLAEEVAQPLPVPCTVLYSRSDGLVHWPACVDSACPEDCIEIAGPHVLIACNAQVMGIVAERLAGSTVTMPGACSR
jgi:pimeloyl-ACP methyl ester carboxylesterase